jgi:hypothetical protein
LKTLLRASTAVLFSLDEFFPTRFSHARFWTSQRCNISKACDVLFSPTFFPTGFLGGVLNEAYTWYIIGQGGVLWINIYCGQLMEDFGEIEKWEMWSRVNTIFTLLFCSSINRGALPLCTYIQWKGCFTPLYRYPVKENNTRAPLLPL